MKPQASERRNPNSPRNLRIRQVEALERAFPRDGGGE
jgi:hypothetical protein